MILTYEGVDITKEVAVTRCVYEACEFGRVPWLSLEFADNTGIWDRWNPEPGDKVSVVEPGLATTGAMYIDRVQPIASGYALHATALPVQDVRAVREWRNTTFLTVAQQLSSALGLGFKVYGCTDMDIAYARQDDERALALLARLAVYAGCIFDVHDGVLHMCSRSWVEVQDSCGSLVLETDTDYAYSRRQPYLSCSITQEEATGIVGINELFGSGEPRLAIVLGKTVAFPGSSELRRACAGALAYANAKCTGGSVGGSELSPFSPGSVCYVSGGDAPSISGLSVITRVRNDFAASTSKTWWRSL